MPRAQERKAAEKEAVLEVWFAEFDVSGTGKLNKEETIKLLTHIHQQSTGDPSASAPAELVDKIMAKFDYSKDGQIERTEVLPAVKRYRALLQHEVKMNALFDKHDTDASGVLSSEQLLALLVELARENGSSEPTADADLAFVLENVDSEDTTGDSKGDSVTREQLGPAVALWYEYASDMKETKSSACVLL